MTLLQALLRIHDHIVANKVDRCVVRLAGFDIQAFEHDVVAGCLFRTVQVDDAVPFRSPGDILEGNAVPVKQASVSTDVGVIIQVRQAGQR
jgi:hypothetical protein